MRFRSEMLHVYLTGGTQDTDHDPGLFPKKVTEAMCAGIIVFQYREKGSTTLSEAQRLNMTRQMRKLDTGPWDPVLY